MLLTEMRKMLTGYVFCTVCNALNYLYADHRWPKRKPYVCTYCRAEGRDQ